MISFLHVLWNNMHCLPNNNSYQQHNLVWHFLKWAQRIPLTPGTVICTGVALYWVFSHGIPKTLNSAQTCPVGRTFFQQLLFVLRITIFEKEIQNLDLHACLVTCLFSSSVTSKQSNTSPAFSKAHPAVIISSCSLWEIYWVSRFPANWVLTFGFECKVDLGMKGLVPICH